MVFENDFIKKWIKLGEDNDEYVKFYCYYIAFNHLYNEYNAGSEIQKIILFLTTSLNSKKFNKFKIEIKEDSELCSRVVHDMKNDRPCKYYKLEDLKNNNPISIFMAIYQIRCNLFHGNKALEDSRNKQLVKEGAEILYKFLTKYIEN